MNKVLKNICMLLLSFFTGMLLTAKVILPEIDAEKMKSAKTYKQFVLMMNWLRLNQNGQTIRSYLEQKGYTQVAIYGMGFVADRLIDEMKSSKKLKITCGIDRNAEQFYADFKLVTINDELPEFDLVIVTSRDVYQQVLKDLRKKVTCPVMAIEDILSECLVGI